MLFNPAVSPHVLVVFVVVEPLVVVVTPLLSIPTQKLSEAAIGWLPYAKAVILELPQSCVVHRHPDTGEQIVGVFEILICDTARRLSYPDRYTRQAFLFLR